MKRIHWVFNIPINLILLYLVGTYKGSYGYGGSVTLVAALVVSVCITCLMIGHNLGLEDETDD